MDAAQQLAVVPEYLANVGKNTKNRCNQSHANETLSTTGGTNH